MDSVNNARERISILIVVRVRLYRDGLAAILNAQEHLRIEGTARTPLEAQAAVRDLQPDVVIIGS